MTREQVYEQQLKELGIFEEAFRPEISTLAQLERELTRAKKAWSATAPKGQKPSMLDDLYGVICSLRREILAHRESLGLTPKALRKLRGAPPPGPTEQELIGEKLDRIAAGIGAYDVADGEDSAAYARRVTREWAALGVSDFDTGDEDAGGDTSSGDARHPPLEGKAKGTDCHTSAAALVRNDSGEGGGPARNDGGEGGRAAEGVGPYGENGETGDREGRPYGEGA